MPSGKAIWIEPGGRWLDGETRELNSIRSRSLYIVCVAEHVLSWLRHRESLPRGRSAFSLVANVVFRPMCVSYEVYSVKYQGIDWAELYTGRPFRGENFESFLVLRASLSIVGCKRTEDLFCLTFVRVHFKTRAGVFCQQLHVFVSLLSSLRVQSSIYSNILTSRVL